MSLRYAITQVSKRQFHRSAKLLAKNDSSTIDSYRLPSQTSINEWEFKYDFIPKTAEPKIPPVSPEAVKQDIAQTKAAEVAKEIENKENATSIKVEANDSAVVHGGESVTAEPEYLQDRGSTPVDATRPKSSKTSKPANREKYLQSSVNPTINQSEVSNLSTGQVDHKAASVEQSQILEEVEHEDAEKLNTSQETTKKGTSIAVPLGLGALLGYAGWKYYSSEEKK